MSAPRPVSVIFHTLIISQRLSTSSACACCLLPRMSAAAAAAARPPAPTRPSPSWASCAAHPSPLASTRWCGTRGQRCRGRASMSTSEGAVAMRAGMAQALCQRWPYNGSCLRFIFIYIYSVIGCRSSLLACVSLIRSGCLRCHQCRASPAGGAGGGHASRRHGHGSSARGWLMRSAIVSRDRHSPCRPPASASLASRVVGSGAELQWLSRSWSHI